jgi:hypothetical protein
MRLIRLIAFLLCSVAANAQTAIPTNIQKSGGVLTAPFMVNDDKPITFQDVVLSNYTPASTGGKLYQIGGALYWNGIAVGSGVGSVTSVATGTGLTGGPITTSGTISVGGMLLKLANLADAAGCLQDTATGAWSIGWPTYSQVGAAPASTVSFPGFGTSGSTACVGNDARLSDSRVASDVYAWAKAATKPSYTYSDVGADVAGAAAAITLSGLGGVPSSRKITSVIDLSSDRNLTYSDVGADASGAAAARQAAFTILTTLGNLSTVTTGWLHNNAGTLAYSTPTYSDVGADVAWAGHRDQRASVQREAGGSVRSGRRGWLVSQHGRRGLCVEHAIEDRRGSKRRREYCSFDVGGNVEHHHFGDDSNWSMARNSDR